MTEAILIIAILLFGYYLYTTMYKTEELTACGEVAQDAVLRMCADNPRPIYTSEESGEPIIDYKEFILSQAVDQSTIQSHKEFVSDRLGDLTKNLEGKTWAPRAEIETDQINWMGIRGRPQAVPVCNPDQVPDVDYDWYAKKAKLTWTS